MGFWSWFLGPKVERPAARADLNSASITIPAELKGDGSCTLDLVGEKQYQENLAAVTGGRTRRGCNVLKVATLILEDSNPADQMAVRVDVFGSTIGYLNRNNARLYRQRLAAIGRVQSGFTCFARIICGPQSGHSHIRLYGAWVDIDLNRPQS
jgi:hypothetical protein